MTVVQLNCETFTTEKNIYKHFSFIYIGVFYLFFICKFVLTIFYWLSRWMGTNLTKSSRVSFFFTSSSFFSFIVLIIFKTFFIYNFIFFRFSFICLSSPFRFPLWLEHRIVGSVIIFLFVYFFRGLLVWFFEWLSSMHFRLWKKIFFYGIR